MLAVENGWDAHFEGKGAAFKVRVKCTVASTKNLYLTLKGTKISSKVSVVVNPGSLSKAKIEFPNTNVGTVDGKFVLKFFPYDSFNNHADTTPERIKQVM